MSSTGNVNALIAVAAQGQTLNVLGERVVITVPSEAVGGRYAMATVECGPDSGPPLHVHSREDEIFYVLEGALEIQCGDDRFIAQAGDTAVLPCGVPHTFRNHGAIRSKVLVTMVPGGFEQFFVETHRLQERDSATPEAVMALGAKFGMAFLPDEVPQA
jgi:mannose-6-phosphate isomerase-like protein (cupin superfamily)